MSASDKRHIEAQYKYYRVIVIIIASMVCVAIYFNRTINPPKAAQAAFFDPSAGVIVKVSGDVKHPGVYSVAANSMACSVIKMADIVCSPDCIDKLVDCKNGLWNGCEVRVSRADSKVNVSLGNMPVKERIALQIPLDINELTLEDFDLLPGVGHGLASNIFEYRQSVGGVMSVKDLSKVNGIGDSKYLQLLKYFK